MPALREHLSHLPYHDLQLIATRLGVRTRGQHRKAQWLPGILQAWQTEATRAEILARSRQKPWPPPTVWAGRASCLRRSSWPKRPHSPRRAGPHWSPPPWERPQTVSEELYYAGALCPIAPAPIGRAACLALPLELRAYLAGALSPAQDGRARLPGLRRAVAALVHDVAQALLFLLAQPALACNTDAGCRLPAPDA